MAFGKVGLPRESFWAMTPREFFNAWAGWSEAESDRIEAQHKSARAIAFAAARYHAANTAMSKKQSKAISRQKFDWEKPTRRDGKPKTLNYDKMRGLFEGLAE